MAREDKSDWAVGGGLLLGVGAGFFFLPNGLAFTGCLIGGLGLGLIISPIISRMKGK